ncbi:metal ABC transporter ATP-binding protein [Azohydromonas sediminis]|uniref:metal ABC transporter ATP-binding protein n=1 Tax=Azohydromonas sediminis TaxID=2259674 RepID=UPI000E64C7F2|nr:ABC transporter ATP-binding protein [Azohydromonas sediminis]
MTGRAYALEFDHVEFTYGEHTVLADVSLHVAAHEFVALIGPNGGGKSTLVRLALGLLEPDCGTVRVLGLPPVQARPRVGYVPQFATFRRDFPISVRETVLHGRLGRRAWWRRPTPEDHAAAADAMTVTGVRDLASRAISRLSGGQLQRVLIARALATEPALMLLDEPTAHVDTRAEHGLFDLLSQLRDRMAIVVVSHDIGLVSRHVDRIACLNRTLTCHPALPLAVGALERLYGMPVQLVDHADATAPVHRS